MPLANARSGVARFVRFCEVDLGIYAATGLRLRALAREAALARAHATDPRRKEPPRRG